MFSSFFIDLRDIKTGTETDTDKSALVKLFENHLNGNSDSITELNQNIQPSTNTQYTRGI